MLSKLFFFFFTALAFGAEIFYETDVASASLFVPVGYDNNDEIVVVLDGYLPDACYRLTKPQFSFDPILRKVTVNARARRIADNCPWVRVPFSQEVHVGRLPVGSFTVTTNDGLQTQMLSVGEAHRTLPDDFLYAPVDKVSINYPGGLKWEAVLEGRLTSTCLELEKINVKLTGNTIQVLPIVRFENAGECATACHVIEKPFKWTVSLPYLENEGRYLLHVRSLNGKAVNEVFFRTPFNNE